MWDISGFDLGGPTPDENTIRLFRNKLTETGTLKRGMKAFDWQLQKKGYIPMSGQIVDVEPLRRHSLVRAQRRGLVPAPKQRNTDAEKEAIKAGKAASEIWPNEPNKAVQKDTDACCTLKIGGKIRYRPDGTPLPQIALPVFGYKSHIAIDRRFGFIRESAATSASRADGRMLPRLVTTDVGGLGRQRISVAEEREMVGFKAAWLSAGSPGSSPAHSAVPIALPSSTR